MKVKSLNFYELHNEFLTVGAHGTFFHGHYRLRLLFLGLLNSKWTSFIQCLSFTNPLKHSNQHLIPNFNAENHIVTLGSSRHLMPDPRTLLSSFSHIGTTVAQLTWKTHFGNSPRPPLSGLGSSDTDPSAVRSRSGRPLKTR